MASKQRRVFLVNRYFHPDRSATSQIASDLAAFLAEQGWDVIALTGAGRYDEPARRLDPDAALPGVSIHRVGPVVEAGSSLLRRAGVAVAVHASLAWALWRRARAGDIVVVKTDPPLLSVSLLPIVAMKRLKQVNWLQDVYPEVAAELGVKAARGTLGSILRRLRNVSLRHAAMNVAVGERMKAMIAGLGVPIARITTICNWCDDQHIVPAGPESNRLRRDWGLQDKFVIGYSGNLGRAHEVDTLIGAARLLRDETGIAFLFIGDGYLTSYLKRAVADQGLARMFRFLPYQDAGTLPQSLTVPDIHWLSLNPRLEGLIVPSKFYGIAAAGKPMIAVMAPDGEISSLIRQSDCGAVITPGDSAGFAKIVREWRHRPEFSVQKGHNARGLIESGFDRISCLRRWQALLASIEGLPKSER
ncbi:glycosyltransferase family 4 protein [Labrys sp. KNU-23]|uniref:glycosyltransferase family 4 protein n=1 Tax=Labrys sp. KNU-23 TaxID=2789216 RepID=UPI0011EE1059|nr:glycosyltransferase family 4 protein [Labrys sp. KNU-23]QEN85687.1 glycosyltransferase family 4 protein [Labrys sp. KNU-23]